MVALRVTPSLDDVGSSHAFGDWGEGDGAIVEL